MLLPGDLAVGITGPALLHGEEVGEIGVDEHLDGAEGGLVAEVADHQVLAHALADVAGPEDHQGGVGHSRSGTDPGDEGGREGVVGDGGQGLGPGPVDPELHPRQDPGVPDEQALGRAHHHVPGQAADGEGGLVDQGDHPAGLVEDGDLARVRPRITHRARTLPDRHRRPVPPAGNSHYGRSANQTPAIDSGYDSVARGRGPARDGRGHGDPAGRRPDRARGPDPRPDGTERVGQVHSGQHPAREPGLPGDRRVPSGSGARTSPTGRPMSGARPGCSWPSSTPRRSPASRSSSSCVRPSRPGWARTGRSSRSGCPCSSG